MSHACVHGEEVPETGDEQQRCDEHDHRHRDLCRHHQALNQQALVTGGRSPPTGFHGGDGFDAGRSNCRCDAEDDAGDRRDCGRKSQNAPVSRQDQRRPAALSRERVQQDAAKAAGQEHRNDRSAGSEHEAFGSELANQRHAGRSDGHAHGDLPIARACAGEQQVREVRARNQKNQRRDRKEKLQRVLISSPEGAHARCCRIRGEPERLEARDGLWAIRRRCHFVENAGAERIDVRGRALDRPSGPEPSHDGDIEDLARLLVRLTHRQRDIE